MADDTMKRPNQSPALRAEAQRRERQALLVTLPRTEDVDDERWSLVDDDTLVWFVDAWVRWGDLMLPDRKTVVMMSDGRLVGGYAF